jgi:DNA helicase II / ATP-dependent DNA helicase PcrA
MITVEQKRAIESKDRYILVKAGAGTGKTEVLTRRVIKLLEDDPQLSIKEIAIITFTNKATENLIARLKVYLYHQWKTSKNDQIKKRYRYELEQLNSCQISTIHKFCKSILDWSGPICFEDFQYSPNYKMTESAIYQGIEKAFEEWLHEKELNNQEIYHLRLMPVHQFRKIVLDAYQMLRSQGISIEKALERTQKASLIETGNSRKLKQELVEILSLIYKYHRQFLLHSLDPDHLLEYCYKLLIRRPDITTEIQSMYRHIFVDEFQDTSAFQTGIIRQLCDGKPQSPNLFVVGDSKQSIYQFRGADLSSFENVERWIKRTGTVLPLSTNFRSSGELVYFVNSLFENLKRKKPELSFKPEPLIPYKKPNEPVAINNAYEWIHEKKGESQPKIVAQFIKKKLEDGVSPKDIAILFRKNYSMVEFGTELATLNIPFQIIGSGNFYNQREIVDTYKVVNYMLHSHSPLYKEEALETIYFNHNETELEKFMKTILPEITIKTPAQLLDFMYRITKIREKIAGFSPQVLANLNKLKELTRNLNLKENTQFSEFVSWLSVMITTHQEESLSDLPVRDQVDAVTLITIHKAKGLEFPIVILPNLNETLGQNVLAPPVIYNKELGLEFSYSLYYSERGVRILSNNYDQTVGLYKQDLYSEELRVLYVALTRAEHKLVFVGSEDCPKNAECFQNWLQSI